MKVRTTPGGNAGAVIECAHEKDISCAPLRSLAALALPVLVFTQSAPGDAVSARAKQLHDRAIVIDSHDDTTQRLLFDKTFDISERQKNGNIDIPRMREGGPRRAVLLDLGAERRHRSDGGQHARSS